MDLERFKARRKEIVQRHFDSIDREKCCDGGTIVQAMDEALADRTAENEASATEISRRGVSQTVTFRGYFLGSFLGSFARLVFGCINTDCLCLMKRVLHHYSEFFEFYIIILDLSSFCYLENVTAFST